jgi:peptidoglycan/xylan/chitin deacetylase (PgdA/CDA1 family)
VAPRSAREAAAGATRTRAFAAAVGLLERLPGDPVGVLPVLTYHRVDRAAETPHLYPGLISATPEEFEAQVRFVAERRHPVSVEDVLAARRGGAALPPRPVLLTFDDAYRDFDVHAWPVLRRYGVPAVLFVPTGYPDHPDRPFWWDRLWRAAGADDFRRLRDQIKELPHAEAMAEVDRLADDNGASAGEAPPAVLGWEDLRRLADEGVTLAPHSVTHPLLPRVPDDELSAEIGDSRADLERELGAVAPVFAYPSGAHDDRVVDAVGAAGFKVAFTTERGVNVLGRDDGTWLRLRRINVGGRSNLSVLRAQLLPALARSRRWTG